MGFQVPDRCVMTISRTAVAKMLAEHFCDNWGVLRLLEVSDVEFSYQDGEHNFLTVTFSAPVTADAPDKAEGGAS